MYFVMDPFDKNSKVVSQKKKPLIETFKFNIHLHSKGNLHPLDNQAKSLG